MQQAQEPIRILMLFTIMNRGGAESMVMSYYRHIDRNKVQFDFMVHRQERGAYDDEIESLGGHIYRMRPVHPFSFHKYQKDIRDFFSAHREYRVIHGHCSELGYFVYKEASRRGIPVIIAHAHNSHAQFDPKWIFRTWFKHRMRRYVTNYFTCGTESAIWLFGKKNGSSAILQRNAIDTSLYKFDRQTREEIREELQIPDDALVVGHVGRFNRQKNHEFIIEVFAELLKKNPHAYLILVGEGELKERIEEKTNNLGIRRNVVFTGVRSDVHHLLQAMDVFLMPSFMEGLSLSMVEAQCAGLPCIVSDTIPKEVRMTDLVSFHSLTKAPKEWATIVLEATLRETDREVYHKKIADAGYDISQNAAWLQDYYLSIIRK